MANYETGNLLTCGMRAAAVAFASRSNATVRTRPRRTAARAADELVAVK